MKRSKPVCRLAVGLSSKIQTDLDPREGTPHQKLRINPFRLGCRATRSEQVLYVLTITKRDGDAYRGDG
jgi:mRNA-degrading endonuclease RelE of RelBE toxin-antitoxin system